MRLLIADDHDLIRRGVRNLLACRTDWEIVAEACDGGEALVQAERLKPDVAILDFSMPVLSGPAVAARMRGVSPSTAVIVLTMHDSDDVIREVLRSGARGYVLKTDADEELVDAVAAVAQRRHSFTPRVAKLLLAGFATEDTPAMPGRESRQLTAREHEVLCMLANGITSRQAAIQLKISVRTVESHRMQINRKLGFGSIADLVHYAIKHGLVPPR